MRKILIIPIMFLLLLSFVSALDYNGTRLFYDNGLTGSEYPKTCDYNFNTSKYYFIEHRGIEEYTSLDGLDRFEGASTFNVVTINDPLHIAFATPNKDEASYSGVDYLELNGSMLFYVAFNTPSTSVVCSRPTTFDDITSDENYFYGLDTTTDIITKFSYKEDCSYNIISTNVLPISASDSTYFTITKDGTFYLGNGNDKIYQLDNNLFLRDTYFIENSDFIGVCADEYNLIFVNGTNNAYTTLFNLPNEPSDIGLEFIDGEFYSSNYCMPNGNEESIYYCNDTYFISDDSGITDIYCGNLGTDCRLEGGTCEYDYIFDPEFEVYYNTGYCDTSQCDKPSECEFNGLTECLNSNVQRTCGNYDNDPCLEWSPATTCLANQMCSVNQCKDIDFSSYGTTLSVPTYIVSPKLSDDDNIIYTYNEEATLSVSSVYNGHSQTWSVLANPPTIDLYGNVNCDYDELVYLDYEAQTLDDELPHFVNTTGLILETIANNGDIGIKFKEQETLSSTAVTGLIVIDFEVLTKDHNKDNEITLVFGNEAYNYLTLIVEHNKDTNEYSFYKTSISPENLLYTLDSYIGGGQDVSLKNIHTTATFNVNIGQVDLYTIANFDDGTTQYEQKIQATPFNQENNLTSYLSQITFSALEDSYLHNLKIFKPNEYPNLRDISSINNELFCNYRATGCYDVRFYAMANEVPTYNNYQERRICINELGVSEVGEATTSISGGLINNLKEKPLGQKMLIVIGSIIGTFLIFTLASGGSSRGSGSSGGIFISTGTQEDDTTGGLTKILSVFIPLGLIVFFAITGIIPEWVIILMVVLTAGFVTIFFRRNIVGGN